MKTVDRHAAGMEKHICRGFCFFKAKASSLFLLFAVRNKQFIKNVSPGWEQVGETSFRSQIALHAIAVCKLVSVIT